MSAINTACLFCPLGPCTLSSTGHHLDNLLPPYREKYCNSTAEARDACKHPLPIVLYARSKVEGGRKVNWDLPHYTVAEERVITAFAARVIVHGVRKKINLYYARCPPEWWMSNVRRIMDMYTANRDYEAMIKAVEDVLNDAHRRMNESEYRERPVEQLQHITIGNKVHGNVARRDLTMPGMYAAGGDVNAAGVLNEGKNNLDMVSNHQANNEERNDESDHDLPPPRRRRGRSRIAAGLFNKGKKNQDMVSNNQANNEEREDEPDDDLPRLRRRRGRSRIAAEVINLVSSSPIREAAEGPQQQEEVVKSKEAVKRKATVIFTLTVTVMNTKISIPVTVNMTLPDTISTAVDTSILKGCDPTGFVLAGTDGEIWDGQKWNDVWVEAARGKVRTWSVELKAEKM